ncbi:DUF2000 domain-containing protein [Streptomyces luteocolor]|uniref:DUF2000 domain-containing protein n=1 Tax=Streptomyces luteocolor TaxID=285500 RepID=UPI0008531F13|nr:DUF2000 domain-containing protein [Streptomyces luteocolor]
MPAPELTTDDIRSDLSTRHAKLKWVIVIDDALPAGRQANAAACIAAAMGRQHPALLGADAEDADGFLHPGLPWAGCSVLAADSVTLHALRTKAAGKEDVLIVDMPDNAQRVRVYDHYLEHVAGAKATDLVYCAVSLLGPRNRIDKLVGKLPLLR